ncbi:hypothetical protein BBKW_1215 [Bifidobacterium catenulatum subsp. kashiwanohense JCM 15439 = DSM 21854]|nr:hypothetical protein BBKW_1215 [Bifidobacterium catenulatum subsp. kashiwanohense JCM 15439 = DSM 21854]
MAHFRIRPKIGWHFPIHGIKVTFKTHSAFTFVGKVQPWPMTFVISFLCCLESSLAWIFKNECFNSFAHIFRGYSADFSTPCFIMNITELIFRPFIHYFQHALPSERAVPPVRRAKHASSNRMLNRIDHALMGCGTRSCRIS